MNDSEWKSLANFIYRKAWCQHTSSVPFSAPVVGFSRFLFPLSLPLAYFDPHNFHWVAWIRFLNADCWIWTFFLLGGIGLTAYGELVWLWNQEGFLRAALVIYPASIPILTRWCWEHSQPQILLLPHCLAAPVVLKTKVTDLNRKKKGHIRTGH